ncbi:MAG: protein kinase [Myxococcales bacterium]|nr:protein kinase [Myxococcota bacterium]MDW8281595.1 protein kinase [Myxococcales bacterium]
MFQGYGIGSVLEGTYRLERELGRGVLGTVYAGTSLQQGREHAVRVLPLPADELLAERERFLRDHKIIAQIADPRLPSIHETAVTPEGALIVVSDLWRGETLRQRLRRGPLLPRAAFSLVDTLCQLLIPLHQRGVPHGDIRPENIVFTRNDQLLLADAGIHHFRVGPLRAHPRRAPGIGCYLPPEQIESWTREADLKGDVFALGAVLYEAITGRPAFPEPPTQDGMRPPTRGRSGMMAILRSPPEGTADSAELVSVLEQILALACALRPEERLPDAAALSTTLRSLGTAFLQNGVVLESSNDSLSPSRRSKRRPLSSTGAAQESPPTPTAAEPASPAAEPVAPADEAAAPAAEGGTATLAGQAGPAEAVAGALPTEVLTAPAQGASAEARGGASAPSQTEEMAERHQVPEQAPGVTLPGGPKTDGAAPPETAAPAPSSPEGPAPKLSPVAARLAALARGEVPMSRPRARPDSPLGPAGRGSGTAASRTGEARPSKGKDEALEPLKPSPPGPTEAASPQPPEATAAEAPLPAPGPRNGPGDEATKALAAARAAASQRLLEAARKRARSLNPSSQPASAQQPPPAQQSPPAQQPPPAHPSPRRRAPANLVELPPASGELVSLAREAPKLEAAQIIVDLPDAELVLQPPTRPSSGPPPLPKSALAPPSPRAGVQEATTLRMQGALSAPRDDDFKRTAQVEAVAPVRPPQSRGLVWSLILGIPLAAVVGMLVPQWLLGSSSGVPKAASVPSPADAQRLLGEIDRALDVQDWRTAVLRADQVLRTYPGHTSAQDKRHRAERELQNQLRFDSFRAALERRNTEAALALFAEIPEDSVYKQRARSDVQALRAEYVQSKLAEAEAARRLGLCSEVQRLTQAVLAMEPANEEAMALESRCESRSEPEPAAPKKTRGRAAERRERDLTSDSDIPSLKNLRDPFR